jgi:hypothetical protein
LSASQLTGVSAAISAFSPTNTLDVTATVDGAGLRVSNAAQARIGAIRLGRAASTNFNTFLESSSGVFSIFNGISNTYANMFSVSTTGITGVTLSFLRPVTMTLGLSAAGGITSNGRINAYSGICGSGATLDTLLVSTGITVSSANQVSTLVLQYNSPSVAGGELTTLKLGYFDSFGGSEFFASLQPSTVNASNTTHTLPSVTGNLLNDANTLIAWNNKGNTFSVRQVFNAGITAQGGATFSLGVVRFGSGITASGATFGGIASFNYGITASGATFGGIASFNYGITASGASFGGIVTFTRGISGSGGITFGSAVNAVSGVSAAGITSDSGYRISSSAISAQSGSYILTGADSGKIFTMNAATAITMTVPTGLPIGFNTTVIRLGAGNVGISAALGVSINSFQNQVNIAGQHAAVSLISYTTDTFNLAGGLTG